MRLREGGREGALIGAVAHGKWPLTGSIVRLSVCPSVRFNLALIWCSWQNRGAEEEEEEEEEED